MDCENIKSDIPSFLAEELSSNECQRMLRHMEGCTQCRTELEELEKTWKIMDRWKIDEPPATVKSRLMATVREELQSVHVSWWKSVRRSFMFQTVLGALGLSVIIFLLFPYDKTIGLCESSISNAGFLASFPRALIYFVLGLIYGLVPIFISGIYFSKKAEGNPLTKGLSTGTLFAAFQIPFFIMQCPEFASGLISTMALGMIFGALSGGTGTQYIFNKMRLRKL